VLQFVIVKPVMAACTLTAYTLNHGEEVGWWSATASIIYNISYTFALYGLVRGSRPSVEAVHPYLCCSGHAFLVAPVRSFGH
jgi:hypothetical protein